MQVILINYCKIQNKELPLCHQDENKINQLNNKIMKEFTAIYSTKAIKNIQYSFNAETVEEAVEFASSNFVTFPELVIVENFEGSKANEGVVVWVNGEYVESQDQEDEKTYDVVFNDDYDSNSKGMQATIEECQEYIRHNNGTNHSYFAEYKGGIVSIVCNETGETVYEEEVR